jgi:hypothetical protein
MRASRRLQLAAQHGSALVLLARPAHELKILSAAATRWTVSPSLSGRGLGGGSVRESIKVHTPTPALPLREREGVLVAWPPRLREMHLSPLHSFTLSPCHFFLPSPRWTVHLLRCKGLQPVLRPHELPCEFALEVCRETGSLRLSPHVVDRSGPQKNAEKFRTRLRRSA